jgi:hypothetical protein
VVKASVSRLGLFISRSNVLCLLLTLSADAVTSWRKCLVRFSKLSSWSGRLSAERLNFGQKGIRAEALASQNDLKTLGLIKASGILASSQDY